MYPEKKTNNIFILDQVGKISLWVLIRHMNTIHFATNKVTTL